MTTTTRLARLLGILLFVAGAARASDTPGFVKARERRREETARWLTFGRKDVNRLLPLPRLSAQAPALAPEDIARPAYGDPTPRRAAKPADRRAAPSFSALLAMTIWPAD